MNMMKDIFADNRLQNQIIVVSFKTLFADGIFMKE